MELTNATALVTGGSKGYGAGIAEALKREGVEVWITGRDQAALDATAQRLGVHAVRADVTRGADWDRAIGAVMKGRGRLDILVNNAGAGIHIAPLAEQSDDEIAAVIAINLTGVLLGCRRAATIMAKQQAGTIINISSVCALYAWPGWCSYTAAKAGLNKFSHSLYNEMRPHGVRVTTLTPSWGATEFAKAANIVGGATQDPQKRLQCIQPSQMGDLVVSLCKVPDHLAVPDLTLQPLIQEINPM